MMLFFYLGRHHLKNEPSRGNSWNRNFLYDIWASIGEHTVWKEISKWFIYRELIDDSSLLSVYHVPDTYNTLTLIFKTVLQPRRH